MRTAVKESDSAWLAGPDVATWSPSVRSEDPVPLLGPAPTMSWREWRLTRGVEIGAAARDAHYWRCPDCGTWAGLYRHPRAAQQAGANHRYDAHDRSEAQHRAAWRAARPLVGAGFTQAELDELVAEVSQHHGLAEDIVVEAMRSIAITIALHLDVSKLMVELRDGSQLTRLAAYRLAVDIATRLDQENWVAQHWTPGTEHPNSTHHGETSVRESR
ncbi:hypothetical protein [Amycolatopsis sp. NPDC058986]|uniref:hypothetical protein n=1 Tax=unclassified Amycolatopsis TaxID=2618356 RepID=UPI00366AB245